MSSLVKKEVEYNMYKGQKYKFEGYPEWYNDEIAKNAPIPITIF
jgi:hypothetical protein